MTSPSPTINVPVKWNTIQHWYIQHWYREKGGWSINDDKNVPFFHFRNLFLSTIVDCRSAHVIELSISIETWKPFFFSIGHHQRSKHYTQHQDQFPIIFESNHLRCCSNNLKRCFIQHHHQHYRNEFPIDVRGWSRSYNKPNTMYGGFVRRNAYQMRSTAACTRRL